MLYDFIYKKHDRRDIKEYTSTGRVSLGEIFRKSEEFFHDFDSPLPWLPNVVKTNTTWPKLASDRNMKYLAYSMRAENKNLLNFTFSAFKGNPSKILCTFNIALILLSGE